MSASGNLYSLLTTKTNLRYYEQQLLVITSRYDANLESLNAMQKCEEKYETAYDDVMGESKSIKMKGVEYMKDGAFVAGCGYNASTKEALAEKYAKFKAPKYDEALLETLTEKDVNFDSLKTTLQAMVDKLKAEEEAETTNTQEAAAKTHLLGGS